VLIPFQRRDPHLGRISVSEEIKTASPEITALFPRIGNRGLLKLILI
jgi:hypothetical protein